MRFLILLFFSLISFSSYSQVDSVLSHIEGPIGILPIRKVNLDLVTRVLSSRGRSDDFETRVSRELVRLNAKGYRTDVTNIIVDTKLVGNKLVTRSSCDIVLSKDGRTYVVFQTRGAIGKGFKKKHDTQIQGLESWLSFYFRGFCKRVSTTTITFPLSGGKCSYKQSFFVVARGF